MFCSRCGKEIEDNFERCIYCGAPVVLQEGDKIGKWVVGYLISKGHICETYYVYSRNDVGKAILKRYIKRNALTDESDGDLFITNVVKREIEILRQLRGVEGVPRIYEFLEERNQEYLVLECMPGKNLKRMVEEELPLDEKEVILIGIKVAEIIINIHNKGIIHNDIKPSNIVFDTSNNKAAVIDFDSATVSGMWETVPDMGTMGYIPPERFITRKGNIRSDIYSFGNMLYFLLTGEKNRYLIDGRLKDLREERKDLCEETYAVIEKCCEEDPRSRFENFSEIIQRLESLHKDLNGKNEGYWNHEKRKSTSSGGERAAFIIRRILMIGIACGCVFFIIFLIWQHLEFNWIKDALIDHTASLRKNQSLCTSVLLALMVFAIRVLVRQRDPLPFKLLISAIEFPMDVLGVLLGYVGALFGISSVNVYDALRYLIILIISTLVICYLCYYNGEIAKEEEINKVKLSLFMFASYVVSSVLLMTFATVG